MQNSDLTITETGRMIWQGIDLSWGFNSAEKAGSLLPADMEEFSWNMSDERITCQWQGHKELGRQFTVKVLWKKEDENLCGIIGWTGGDSRYPFTEVLFPIATFPMPEDAALFHAHGQGLLIRNINDSDLHPEGKFHLKQSSMQFSALLGTDISYYFDRRDTGFNCKECAYQAIEGHSRVRYTGIHYLPLDGQSPMQYEIPYYSLLTVFKGGWFEAAWIYKRWARRQWWAKRPPVDPRLRKIGLWVWNRGQAEDVIAPVEKLKQDTGVPLALDWYWWHRNGYDTSYPEYWPPREGEPVFEQAILRLNRQDIFTQVYLNGVLWDKDADHWQDGGDDAAVKDRDGKVKSVMFNIFAKKHLAWMCGGGNTRFRERIGSTVDKLRCAGLPGVYLDMIGCASYDPCYNEAHTHAPGGGNYQVAGFRKMLEDIRRKHPGLLLSTEEPNEAYMDLCDSAITLSSGAERLGYPSEPVPAFNAVYHGLTAVFGSYALPDFIPPFDPMWPGTARWENEPDWPVLYPDQFFAEIARAVIWGLQPTVANIRMEHVTSPEYGEMYAFLVETVRFYHAHLDFLFDGDMLAPGILKTGEIEVKFLSRFIFTEEGNQRTVKRSMPAVLHSLWKAPDGRVGLVLVNFSRDEREYRFEDGHRLTAGRITPRSWHMVEFGKDPD